MRRRLDDFAADYARRERELEEARAQLRREREEAAVQAHRDGLPMEDIGEALGITRQRVSEIIQRAGD